MAKKIKIININDGTATELTNGNRHYIEEFFWTEEAVMNLLNQGYELKHMIPDYTPAIQKDGCYSFYKSGFVLYFEKEYDPADGEPEDSPWIPNRAEEDFSFREEDFAEFDFSEDEDE